MPSYDKPACPTTIPDWNERLSLMDMESALSWSFTVGEAAISVKVVSGYILGYSFRFIKLHFLLVLK